MKNVLIWGRGLRIRTCLPLRMKLLMYTHRTFRHLQAIISFTAKVFLMCRFHQYSHAIFIDNFPTTHKVPSRPQNKTPSPDVEIQKKNKKRLLITCAASAGEKNPPPTSAFPFSAFVGAAFTGAFFAGVTAGVDAPPPPPPNMPNRPPPAPPDAFSLTGETSLGGSALGGAALGAACGLSGALNIGRFAAGGLVDAGVSTATFVELSSFLMGGVPPPPNKPLKGEVEALACGAGFTEGVAGFTGGVSGLVFVGAILGGAAEAATAGLPAAVLPLPRPPNKAPKGERGAFDAGAGAGTGAEAGLDAGAGAGFAILAAGMLVGDVEATTSPDFVRSGALRSGIFFADACFGACFGGATLAVFLIAGSGAGLATGLGPGLATDLGSGLATA